MAAPLWTQSDIDTLKAAIASGTSSVTFTSGGVTRSRTFHSLAEMRALLAEMVAQVGGRPRYRRVAFSKGFDRG